MTIEQLVLPSPKSHTKVDAPTDRLVNTAVKLSSFATKLKAADTGGSGNVVVGPGCCCGAVGESVEQAINANEKAAIPTRMVASRFMEIRFIS